MEQMRHQQDILARDLIQLALDRWTDKDIIERASDYFFSLSMIFEETNPGDIDWHNIFSLLDAHYTDFDSASSHDLRGKLADIYGAIDARISRPNRP